MKKALIKPYGFAGDHLFASSVAEKLINEGQFDIVDMTCGFKQVERLLRNNPYVNGVFTMVEPTIAPLHGIRDEEYDVEFELTETSKYIPPPTQFQIECGVHHPETEFHVYTNPEIDDKVERMYPHPIIAVMNLFSWEQKAYGFTLEEYIRGVDVPNLGYGGRLRDIGKMVENLVERTDTSMVSCRFVEVGLTPDVSTLTASKFDGSYRSLEWDASVIKKADYFIGAEGGLANVAAGVGTTCVLTGEFVHCLYGWNGVIKKIIGPELGPRFYFPDAGHIDLNPYLTDGEVVNEMVAIFKGEKKAGDYDYNWTRG